MDSRAIVLGALMLFLLECNASVSVVSNIIPRLDSSGKIIDAHDGNVVQNPHDPNQYFYFAAGYGNCVEPVGKNGALSRKFGH